MKIRDETVSTAPTVQTSLDRFREVLRERAEANPSLLARVRRLFGRSPDPEIETVRTDLFAELDGVDSIEPVLDDVVATYQTDGPTAALDRFDESFGSVCDEAVPPVLSTDRQRSRCHRHRDEYDPPDAVDPRA